MSVDRLELIRKSAEKYNFKKNLQVKTKKLMKPAAVAKMRKVDIPKDIETVDTEYFTYRERRIFSECGIGETYHLTTMFDSEHV
jgi:hypothetical protein